MPRWIEKYTRVRSHAPPAVTCLVLLLACGQAVAVGPSFEWKRLRPMPEGVFGAAAGRRGELAVISGGIDRFGAATSSVQILDLNTMRWRPVLRMPRVRCLHAQVTLADGRLLMAGGQRGRVGHGMKPIASAVVLDLDGPRLERVPDLPVAMAQPTAHLLPDGRAVVIGSAYAALFDPSLNRWADPIRLRHRRRAHASVLLDARHVLVVGGWGTSSIELIDVVAGTTRLFEASLPQACDDMALAFLDARRALVIGGQLVGSGDTTDQAWIVELQDGGGAILAPGPSMGIEGGVADHRAVAVGRRLAVLGGETQRAGMDTELAQARLVNLDDLSVRVLPPMQEPHDDAVAIGLDDGIIIFGGYRRVAAGLLRVPVASRTVERLVWSDPGAVQ
jgi:hypothetical protein